MRTHTSQFKEEIKQYGRQITDKIYYNNTTYNGDHIFSANYSVDTTLCKSIMQTLKIDTDISVSVGDVLDYGISLENTTDEIRFNNFIVEKIEEQKDKKSNLVTCYDNMIKAMKDYETPKVNGTAITYPITVRNYLSAICNHLGLTFKNASDTFTNYDKNITSEHYVDTDGNGLGYTFRDVLDDLAEATGSFIRIDNNGQLEIKDFTNTQDTINEEYFKDKNVNVGKKIGPYNVVVLSRQDVDNLYYPSTLPSNPIEFKISDNAILDQTNREDFIQGIYNKINGLEFYLNDFATNGILYYEIGDKYNVSIDNTTYPCLMLNDDIKRTTGLKENIRTDEPKQSVTEFKYASSTDRLEKQSRNAIIKVDKANASIEQIVSAVGSNGQVTSASIIQSINNDTSQIKLEADKIDLNGAVTANGNFIINQDGSVEINSGYLELTDDPSDPEDRIIIKSSDGTRITSITSNEIFSREVGNDYNHVYMGDDYFQVISGDDANNFNSIGGREDFITLTKKVNGTTTRSTYASDGATINGKETINTTGNNYAGLEINNSPSRQESAITYKNGNKEYTAGYGINNFDGWGIYSWETSKNIFEINKNGDTNIAANLTFKPLYTQTLDLNNIGSWNNPYSQEIALHNQGNILNAPANDEVAILKTYSWGGNGDWAVQEWYGLNTAHKYIRYRQVSTWTGWRQLN